MLSKSKTNCIVWMNKLDHISIIILFIHEFLINVTSNDDVRWSWNQAKLSKARHFAQIALDFEMQIKLESIAIGNNILVSFRFVLMSTILIAAIILFYLFGCLFQAQINDVGAIWLLFSLLHRLAPSGRLNSSNGENIFLVSFIEYIFTGLQGICQSSYNDRGETTQVLKCFRIFFSYFFSSLASKLIRSCHWMITT